MNMFITIIYKTISIMTFKICIKFWRKIIENINILHVFISRWLSNLPQYLSNLMFLFFIFSSGTF